MSRQFKISKKIQQALEEIGDYRLERGGCHIKVFVGDVFAGILPGCCRGDGESNGYGARNVLAQIRRAARGVPA